MQVKKFNLQILFVFVLLLDSVYGNYKSGINPYSYLKSESDYCNEVIKNMINSHECGRDTDIVSCKYTGGYTGIYKIEDHSEEGFYITKDTICFYLEEDKMYMLEEGVLTYDYLSVCNNYLFYGATDSKTIIGEFESGPKSRNRFVYYFYPMYTDSIIERFFLNKIISEETAQNIVRKSIDEYNSFRKFLSKFILALKNRDESYITGMINYPFYDKRESWDDPAVYDEKSIRPFLNELLSSEPFNDDFFIRYENNDKEFPGLFRFDLNKMFIYIGLINGQFKIVQATNIFG